VFVRKKADSLVQPCAKHSPAMSPGDKANRKNGLGIIGKSLYGNKRTASAERNVSANVMLRPKSREIPIRRFI